MYISPKPCALKDLPTVGDVIPCVGQQFQFLNSTTPSVRIQRNAHASVKLGQNVWESLAHGSKTGLIVFVTQPASIPLDRVCSLQVTRVKARTAFARALFS